VEIYGRVRRAVLVEGRSQREVAREFGISRKTIQKMLRYAVPPGYQRQQPVKRPKLGPWLGLIDAMQEEWSAVLPRPASRTSGHSGTRLGRFR
jgi:transposase